jgi:hypothetical protein
VALTASRHRIALEAFDLHGFEFLLVIAHASACNPK